jgi:hypothetical protein
VHTLIFWDFSSCGRGGREVFYVFWACSHFSEFLQNFVEIKKKSMAALSNSFKSHIIIL